VIKAKRADTVVVRIEGETAYQYMAQARDGRNNISLVYFEQKHLDDSAAHEAARSIAEDHRLGYVRSRDLLCLGYRVGPERAFRLPPPDPAVVAEALGKAVKAEVMAWPSDAVMEGHFWKVENETGSYPSVSFDRETDGPLEHGKIPVEVIGDLRVSMPVSCLEPKQRAAVEARFRAKVRYVDAWREDESSEETRTRRKIVERMSKKVAYLQGQAQLCHPSPQGEVEKSRSLVVHGAVRGARVVMWLIEKRFLSLADLGLKGGKKKVRDGG
jgi:hypothetical protein